MHKSRGVIRVLLGFGILISLSGCLISDQDSAEIFSDGKLPHLLDELVNPKPPADVKQESQNSLLLDVAVIDEGVDYTHPHLQNRVRYDWKDGQITGVGVDVFGNDNWAHPNLYSPWLFGLGAKMSDDHRLTSYSEDPVKDLNALNDKFMNALESEIASSSTLSNSLFRKITKASFHVLGAYQLIQEESKALKTYQQFKEHNRLITAFGFRQDTWEEKSRYPEGYLRAVISEPWEISARRPWPGLDSYEDTPEFARPESKKRKTDFDSFDTDDNYGGVSNLYRFDGYDEFVKVVEKVFEKFDKQTNFTEKFLKPYFEVRKAFEADKIGGGFDAYRSTSDQDSAVRALYASWFAYAYGGSIRTDPLYLIMRDYCRSLSNEDYLQLRTASKDQLKTFFASQLKDSYQLFHEVANYATTPAYSKAAELNTDRAPLQRAVRRYLRDEPKLHKFIDQILSQRGELLLSCDPAAFETVANNPMKDQYSRFSRDDSNPYLEPAGKEASHGTHVSGIISAQDEAIGIFPVRVIVEGIQTRKEKADALRNKFEKEFNAWIKADPTVFYAVIQLLKPHIDELGSASGKEVGADYEKTVAQVTESLSPFMDEVFRAHQLIFYFVDQILKAIEVVGQRHIKIANISLGTEQEIGVGEPSEKEDRVIQHLQFLIYEFFKYKIGQTIQTKAPSTVFVIAGGNSGSWVDGRSRSALPCDIGSPFLAEAAEQMKSAAAPNNDIKNIVCVGSLNKRGELSQFTNLVVNPKVNFFVTYGEKIRSALKTSDCSGIDEMISKEIKRPALYLSSSSSSGISFERFLIDQGRLPEKATDKEKGIVMMREGRKYALARRLLGGLYDAALVHRCITATHDEMQGRWSGTSMATPAIAGYLAKVVIEKMKAAQLTQDKIYSHPDFQPEVLVKDLSKKATYCSKIPESILSKIPAITDVKEMPEYCVLKFDEGKKSSPLPTITSTQSP